MNPPTPNKAVRITPGAVIPMPCWLWMPKAKSWQNCLTARSWNHHYWTATHYHPDQPEAPTFAPEEDHGIPIEQTTPNKPIESHSAPDWATEAAKEHNPHLLTGLSDDTAELFRLAAIIRKHAPQPTGKQGEELAALRAELKDQRGINELAEAECVRLRADLEASRNQWRMSSVCRELNAELEKARAERDAAVKERGQLFSALNFKQDAPFEMVLADAKLLRPEMAKARNRVKEIEGHAMWDDLYLEGMPGFLVRLWKRLRQTEAEREHARQEAAELRGEVEHERRMRQTMETRHGELVGQRLICAQEADKYRLECDQLRAGITLQREDFAKQAKALSDSNVTLREEIHRLVENIRGMEQLNDRQAQQLAAADEMAEALKNCGGTYESGITWFRADIRDAALLAYQAARTRRTIRNLPRDENRNE